MEKYTLSEVESIVEDTLTDSLDVVLRTGARKMLQVALENEVSEYISRYQDHKDDEGHRLVVRNGYHKPRGENHETFYTVFHRLLVSHLIWDRHLRTK